MRRLAVVLALLAPASVLAEPTLDQTLEWVSTKLRDFGKVEYRDPDPKFGANMSIEQSMPWMNNTCVWLYRRTVTVNGRPSLSGLRVPLAEMDPNGATARLDSCAPWIANVQPAQCAFVKLTSRNNKDVVLTDLGPTQNSRSNRMEIILRASEWELAQKMRDAFRHATKLCQAAEPVFPQ